MDAMRDWMLSIPVVVEKLLDNSPEDVEAVRASASSVDDPRLLEVDVITGLDDPEVVEKEELVTTVSLLG